MAGGFVGEDGLEFLSAHRLVRKQEFRHGDEVLLIAREDVLAALVGRVDDGLDLLVDLDSNEIEPSLSLMPYTVTILRAICEARWISFDAPVEMSPSISFSATRPPSSETICSSI